MNYTSAKPYFYGTGRRKKSVARVRLYPGTGDVKINNRSIDDYFGLDTLKLVVNQPFAVTSTEGKYDVVCTVTGGGVSGQASDILIEAKEIEKCHEELYRILSTNCNQPYDKVFADADRNYWMTADEALAYGMVDNIIKK